MNMATDHARRERRLEAARRAYRESFGEDAPVRPFHLHNPRLPDLLLEAVEAGEPLTAEAVAKGLGPRPGRSRDHDLPLSNE
jgi:hypothetical protein